jgi:hypothetical protein
MTVYSIDVDAAHSKEQAFAECGHTVSTAAA